MKVKIKKGVKINSVPEDGHPDESPVIIIAFVDQEYLIDEREFYYCLYEDNLIPIGTTSTRILITEDKSEEMDLDIITENFLNRLPKKLVSYF